MPWTKRRKVGPVFDAERYREEGFLELPGALGERDLARAIEAFDRLEEAGEVPAGLEAEYDEAGGRRRLRKLRRLLWEAPDLWAPILVRAGVAELGRDVLGEEATIVFHAAFLKSAEFGTPVAPHQDQALWSRQYPGAFSVWFALGEVNPGNGGLFGFPHSHARGLVAHRDDPAYPWHGSLDPEADSLGEAHQFVLRPGDAAMWDRYLAHGSAANYSPEDRRGMVVVIADGAAAGFDPIDAFPVRALWELVA
jgi:ectoine hydroxylase-related dioxygenase (phytanoyl-CoA dioxygenase family)